MFHAVLSLSTFEVITLIIKKIAVAVLLICMAPIAWSQGGSRFGSVERGGEWDISIGAVYMGSESVGGEGPEGQPSSSLEIDDDWGFAFAFGYNFTNHWALSFDMSFLTPRYQATLIGDQPGDTPETFSHKMDMFSGLVRGTYHFLEGPITPFVDLSAGFTYIDSNVADRPPTTGCWWDPWWGYVCQTFVSTYSDTRFNYGGGLGLRWDINSDLFLRATYSVMKLDLSSSSDPTFGIGRIDIGWGF
jgi:opacity protein-like surface antigen